MPTHSSRTHPLQSEGFLYPHPTPPTFARTQEVTETIFIHFWSHSFDVGDSLRIPHLGPSPCRVLTMDVIKTTVIDARHEVHIIPTLDLLKKSSVVNLAKSGRKVETFYVLVDLSLRPTVLERISSDLHAYRRSHPALFGDRLRVDLSPIGDPQHALDGLKSKLTVSCDLERSDAGSDGGARSMLYQEFLRVLQKHNVVLQEDSEVR